MKATHTGRLKNISDLITDIKLNSNSDSVLKNFIIFLDNNEGAIIELEETAIGWRNEDFGFRDSMFSKIEEIKPKKEMRPLTDEELIEYLMTEGWFIHEDGIKYHPMKIDDKNKAVYVAEDLIEVYATFDQIKNNYTDRHGNKFEKEV